MPCRPLYYGDGFLRGVLGFVDCQAQNLGAQGYQALAAPGSVLSILLTGLLTLFVAFYGYRMLFGQTPSARDGVLALAKIGIVLALATSWPAYRALVYDVALHGPAQLAAEVGRPARLPGADGGLVARLGYVDDALVALADLGIGTRDSGETVTRVRIIDGREQTVVEPAQKPVSAFEPIALGGARVLFLTSSIAALASVRIVAGLLLALGPFFFAFLLFDGTRGLFEGWLRGLAGAALGALGVTIVLGVELALIEPWIANLVDRRAAGLSIAGAPPELLVVMLVFSVTLIATVAAAARIALGFRLPVAWRAAPAQLASSFRGEALGRAQPVLIGPAVPAEQRSRAAAVAEAVAASQRRETTVMAAAPPPRAGSPAMTRDLPPPAPVPLGQSYGRRTRNRVSGRAGRRDAGA